MRLVTYTAQGEPRLAAIRDDRLIDLAEVSDGRLPADMMAFLDAGEDAMALARDLVAKNLGTRELLEAALLAPVPAPSKVVAIGLNYMDHCREQGHEPPKQPVIFAKFPTAVTGPAATIRWDPALTSQVDYEVELAVIVGRTARRVHAGDAQSYIAGYSVANDISARDLQFGDGQWVRGKSLDTFCPLGPCLVTSDEVADPHDLAIRCFVNGTALQDSSTAEMIFRVPELIAFITRAFTLVPGDVILTGTPHGVGVFRTPPVFLRDGDTVTAEIEGVGQLTNFCVEERSA